MYIRNIPAASMSSTVDELRAFDSAYVTNADSYIFDNICAVLHCTPDSIHGIIPIKTGLTNLSFKFTCNGRLRVPPPRCGHGGLHRPPGRGAGAGGGQGAGARRHVSLHRRGQGLEDLALYRGRGHSGLS
ncbi:MAG: hypothetical protein ACLSHG_06345 [Oscillospiraceae bacterium]